MNAPSRWASYSHIIYTTVFFVFFTAQVIAALAFIAFAIPPVLERTSYPLAYLLVLAVILALAFLLLIVNSMSLSIQAFHAGKERSRIDKHRFWLERWEGVMSGSEPLPDGPLPPEGVTALLDFKDSLEGEEAEAAFELARYFGIEDKLMAQLASKRRTLRLSALESLAKLRSPLALPLLFQAAYHPHPPLRYRALRALARTIAVMPDNLGRKRNASSLLNALSDAALPLKASEEVLMLLDRAAIGPVSEILRTYTSESYQRLALEVAGRLGLGDVADDVAGFVSSPNPELRAAALRALGRLGTLPPNARASLVLTRYDEKDYVRAQATRLAAMLPQSEALNTLWAVLSDRSWWVRLAAAQTLSGLGNAGNARLQEAAAQHPDRYGRDAARHVLSDSELQVTQPERRVKV